MISWLVLKSKKLAASKQQVKPTATLTSNIQEAANFIALSIMSLKQNPHVTGIDTNICNPGTSQAPDSHHGVTVVDVLTEAVEEEGETHQIL
jgi:hypothetical protein